MKWSLIILSALTLFACHHHDVAPKEVAQFFLDDQKESIINTSVGTTENCGNFFVTSIDLRNELYVLGFELKLLRSGKIVYIRMNTRDGKRYETQPFNPDFQYSY